MDADVLLKMILLISVPSPNRFHAIWNLDRARNCPFILDQVPGPFIVLPPALLDNGLNALSSSIR